MNSAISVTNLTKSFRDGERSRTVLRDLALEVGCGEMVAVMGPSGSGKSTLLHLLAGLERPDHGEITVSGSNIGDLDRSELATMRRRTIGYVEQRLNLIGSLTAIENVTLPLELDGMGTSRARANAMETLGLVGMEDRADESSDRLSGGEQQRVALARALVGTRSVLLVDEPTAALDSLTGEGIMTLLRKRCDEDRVTVVLATHDHTHAAWADRVVHIHDGVIR